MLLIKNDIEKEIEYWENKYYIEKKKYEELENNMDNYY